MDSRQYQTEDGELAERYGPPEFRFHVLFVTLPAAAWHGAWPWQARPASAAEKKTMIARRRLHRAVFAAAGAYNIAWGVWSVADPQWLFRFTGMPPANHPAIFACLGMVVGLYGILYLEVARVPERGWTIAAVGLLGKTLGPIGMVWLIHEGTWPPSAFVMCVTNDVIWWIPFGVYVHDAWPMFTAR